MAQGRYPPRSDEERAAWLARRKLHPTTLNSGVTVNQVFMMLEEMLAARKRDVPSVGFYTIWAKFVKLAGEPYNSLMTTKLGRGYVGYMLGNDVTEIVEEDLPVGFSPMELGKRLCDSMTFVEEKRLGRFKAFRYRTIRSAMWREIDDDDKEVYAFAAQAIFDMGYQAGLSAEAGKPFQFQHVKGVKWCFCAECSNIPLTEGQRLALRTLTLGN